MVDRAESLAAVCTKLGLSRSRIVKWLNKDFADEYADAKQERAEHLADLLTDACDIVLEGNNYDHSKVALAKLQVDTLKWIASKLKPQSFGDFQRISVPVPWETGHGGIQVSVVKYQLEDDADRSTH
jgi:hypothetical protein